MSNCDTCKGGSIHVGGGMGTGGAMVSGGSMGYGGKIVTAGGVPKNNYRDLYHQILGLPNNEWEKIRERASQRGGKPPHPFHDNIRENTETNPGKRAMFRYISNLNAPRIAARMIERNPDLTTEQGGHFGEQMNELLH